jgi:GMP synthase (glutamine-hydrolysing)
MNINRLVYVFGEPVTQILTEITPTYLTKDVITQIQEADNVVNEILLQVCFPHPR